jgi:hypothetical protein
MRGGMGAAEAGDFSSFRHHIFEMAAALFLDCSFPIPKMNRTKMLCIISEFLLDQFLLQSINWLLLSGYVDSICYLFIGKMIDL